MRSPFTVGHGDGARCSVTDDDTWYNNITKGNTLLSVWQSKYVRIRPAMWIDITK